jgi:hypothetical protein
MNEDGTHIPSSPTREGTTIEQVTMILEQAVTEIGGRATTYDQPDGEESMPKVIALFNRLYGTDLTAEQGWMFMVLLKAVRSSNGAFKLDNYVDLAAYAAFAGKAARDQSASTKPRL